MALLTVADLQVSFHTRRGVIEAVNGIGFEVERGRTLGIVGESGSGKSTVCLALLGLLPAPPARIGSGSAMFDGVDLLRTRGRSLRKLRGRRISMIFQDPLASLNPYLSIGAQLMEPLQLHLGVSRNEARERAASALDEVGIRDPARRLGEFPHEFSGGMRQRVMIAMALAAGPDLLIADEPTTALDVTIQAQILDLIRRLQVERNLGVIFVSHNLGVIAGIADDVLVMRDGRCVESGPAPRVFAQPAQAYTRQLLDSIPAGAKPTAAPVSGGMLLEVRGLSVNYGTRSMPAGPLHTRACAVENVSLEVRRGEILGLVGESGSGKSSLARAIVRLIEPAGGEVRLAGVPVSKLAPRELRRIRPRLQMVFQDPYSSLDPRMTIHSCLHAALEQRGVAGRQERLRGIERLMREVGLDPDHVHRYPHEFSGGQRQRIAIARALALEPELLVADEPVSSLDVTVQAQILRLLLDLNQRGLSMIFISHDLAVIRHLADRTAVMLDGKIVEINDTEALYARPVHPYTRALLSAIPVPDPGHERNRRRIAWTGGGTYPEQDALPPGSA